MNLQSNQGRPFAKGGSMAESIGQHVGRKLGNYQVTHVLGAGGFAEVYLGEHIHLSTQAAIKVQ